MKRFFATTLILGAAINATGLAPQAAETKGLFTNGDFSLGIVTPDGWTLSKDSTPGSEILRDAQTFKTGPAALRINLAAGGKATVSQTIAPTETEFNLSGWTRTEGNVKQLRYDLQVFDAQWKQLAWITSGDNATNALGASSEWRQFNRKIALPKGSAQIIFYFVAEGTGSAWLDELQASVPPRADFNPQAQTQIAASAPVQLLGLKPYKWGAMATGGVEYATGLFWNPNRPADLFLRADGGGIWKFDRAYDRWSALMDNIPWKWSNLATVESLAVHPQQPATIYVAGGSSRWGKPFDILKTVDGGKSWTRTHLKNEQGRDVVIEGNGSNKQAGERLAIDPNSPDVIFFGSRNDGLFVSRDGAKSWSQVKSFPAKGSWGNGITFVTFDPRTGKQGQGTPVVYAGTHAGKTSEAADAPRIDGAVYKSSDAGLTWTKLEGGPGPAASPLRGRVGLDGTLFVTLIGSSSWDKSGGGGGVWKYTAGQWTEITPPQGKGKPFSGINVHPSDPKQILTGNTYSDGPNVYLSRDGGATWTHFQYRKNNAASNTLVLDAFPAWEGHEGEISWGGNASDVAFDPANPENIWHTSFSGPSRGRLSTTPDGHPQLRMSIIGLGREQMTTAEAVSPSAGAPFISGVWDVGGFRYEKNAFDKVPEYRLQLRKPDGTQYSGYDKYRNGYQDIFDLDTSPVMPDVIVAAGGWQWNNTGDASISLDNGRSFRVFPNKPFKDAKFGRIAVSSTNPRNIVWAPMGSDKEAVYFTKDAGTTWQAAHGAPLGMINTQGVWTFFKPLAADRVDPNTFYIYDRRDGRFYRSRDGGGTWKHLSTLPKQPGNHWDNHKLEAAPGVEGELWLSLHDQGLFRSTDGGQSWTQMTGVNWAVNFSFGKSAPGKTNPSVFLMGQLLETPTKNEQEAEINLFRSDDRGKTWLQINGSDRGLAQVNNVTGDWQKHGRVYIGTGGRGHFHGTP